MSQKISLVAVSVVSPVGGRGKFLSHVLIKQNELHVAWAKLVGKWSKDQALAEFKKNPTKFTATPKFAGTLQALAQAA